MRVYSRTTHCKNGHPRTPANTYTNPTTGEQHCRVCWREWKRRKSGSTKESSTYYTKMREAEIAQEQAAAQAEHERMRAESRRQRESFEQFFGKIGEHYKSKAWTIRFGVFVLGWKEAEEHHAISNRPRLPEALVDKTMEASTGARARVQQEASL